MTKVKDAVQKIEVGTIFVSSWGYEQTNIDFYQVVRMTNKTVWIQEVEKEYVEQTGWAHYAVKATNVPKMYYKNIYNNEGVCVGNTQVEAPVLRKKVSDGYIRISSFEYAKVWDGELENESHTH